MTINNNNIFGAFTLGEVRSGRLTGDWLNKEFVANYGWFGGGGNPGEFSTVDRIDFSNDSATASPRGSLSSARYQLVATGNSNYGWFGGGKQQFPSVTYSRVDRIDFSNDSGTASVRGPLSTSRDRLAATGNSNYGWFGGGSIPTPATYSTVDRIDFSNDSATASPRGSLSLTRYILAATGNSNYGWFGGGYSPSSRRSTVDRIDLSNDSATVSVRGPLSSARYRLAATGNSNYGWFGGGSTGSPIATVDRIDFSNDLAIASVRGLLSQGKYDTAATGNSNYGWFGGGATPIISTVDRIDFSNDSATASPRGRLSSARYALAATSGVLNIRRQKAGSYGWFAGGSIFGGPPGGYDTIDRLDFSNDFAATSPRGFLSNAGDQQTTTGNSDYGFFINGGIPANLDRMTFANDTVSTLRRTVTLSRGSVSATGNSNYGWFGGGFTPGTFPTPDVRYSRVDRLDFSNDSSGFTIRGSLSQSRSGPTATGNSNYGWFGGGYVSGNPGSLSSRVDRINFANDSPGASIRGPLSFSASNIRSVGNSNYGWFVNMGDNHDTTRVNFINDLVQSTPRGKLQAISYNNISGRAATGNSNYGWFGGGEYFGPSTVNWINRLNFSNDTAALTFRGGLSIAKRNLTAVSNTTR